MKGEASKTILVTGATAGIGRYVALDLAERGHRVFATGRNAKALAMLEAEATKRGVGLSTVVLDVTDTNSIEAAKVVVRRATEGRGIDVLVNNAGNSYLGNFEELTNADIERQMTTNFYGVVNVLRAALPILRKQRSGHIINVSSE